MQRFVGDRLYHLVGFRAPDADPENFQILRAILRSMKLRTCEVAGERGGIRTVSDSSRWVSDGEPILQSVVCLCDIPWGDLGFHARRYGRFGIGVCRSLVAQWGGRPVTYIPYSSRTPGTWGARFPAEVNSVLEGLERFFPDSPSVRTKVVGAPAQDAQEAVDDASTLIARDVRAFLKFWDIELPEEHPKNYYMEREWRKFGNLALAACLREVIAPPRYHDELRAILNELRAGERYLIPEIQIKNIPE